IAVNCSERKKPPTTRMIMIKSSGVAAVNSAQAARKNELTMALIVIMLRKPKVRMMRAASAFIPIAPTAEAKVTRPDWNGVRPKPTCINSGSRNGSAPMPSRNRNPPMMLARSVAKCSIEKSRTGDPVRRACITYSVIEIDPVATNAPTTGHGSKLSPATDNPNAMPPSPMRASTSPYRSKRSGSSLLIGSMWRSAMKMPSRPIGMLIRKIQCQEKKVVMKPPSGGPITGPTSAGTVTHAIALTSALFSMERSSTRRPTGVIIAPPMPCTMRAITKPVTEEDSAQPIDPSMKTPIATANTMRAPKRSAVQPLAGMNTASESRYEVIASFSVRGLVPMSTAIAGSEVAITVESMFSMNRAVATMSGIRRSLFISFRGRERRKAREQAGLYHPNVIQAIAEPAKPPKSCATLVSTGSSRRRCCDDLRSRRLVAAARAAPQRAAVFGDFQPDPDRVLRDFRAGFSRSSLGAVGPRDHRGSHETRGAPASRGRGCDPPARPAAGVPALKACAWQANPLIQPPAMLSTTVNPTDGPRFDGDADSFAEGDVHP